MRYARVVVQQLHDGLQVAEDLAPETDPSQRTAMHVSLPAAALLEEGHHTPRHTIALVVAHLSVSLHHVEGGVLLHVEAGAQKRTLLTAWAEEYQSMVAKERSVSRMSPTVAFSKWRRLLYSMRRDWKNISACVQCLQSGTLNSSIQGVCFAEPFCRKTSTYTPVALWKLDSLSIKGGCTRIAETDSSSNNTESIPTLLIL
jgi:hypothetical protein